MKLPSPEFLRRPMRDVVYEHIKKNILNGEISSEEFFSDNDVAKVFHISRMPVREAMQRLESEGYIERVHMKGNRVKGLSNRDVAHIYSIRKHLESLLLYYTTVRISESDLMKLEAILQEAKKLQLELDELHFIEKWLPMLMEFNKIVFKASDIQQLITIVETLREHISRFNIIRTMLLYHIKESLSAREELVHAFRERNPELASKIWRIHFDLVFKIWIEKMAPKSKPQMALMGDEYIFE